MKHKHSTLVLYACVILLAVAFWIGASYFEAQAFNRATGKNVSTWDAMWTKLRVQGTAND